MALYSTCCTIPSTRHPQLSLRAPSPSTPTATLSSPTTITRVLRLAAEHRWRREPLLETPRHHGACAGAAPSTMTGEGETPSPCPRNRIFVKGLPISTSEGTLVMIFSPFGNVTRVKIITSKTSKQSLGLAYVWFSSEEAAQVAVREMDGKFVDGRFVYVTIANPESPSRQGRATPYRF